MQEYIPGAIVHGQKRPGRSEMSLDFPCKWNMAPWVQVPRAQKHPERANHRTVLQHLRASSSWLALKTMLLRNNARKPLRR